MDITCVKTDKLISIWNKLEKVDVILHRPKRKMRQTFYKKNKKIKFSNIFLVM